MRLIYVPVSGSINSIEVLLKCCIHTPSHFDVYFFHICFSFFSSFAFCFLIIIVLHCFLNDLCSDVVTYVYVFVYSKHTFTYVFYILIGILCSFLMVCYTCVCCGIVHRLCVFPQMFSCLIVLVSVSVLVYDRCIHSFSF